MHVPKSDASSPVSSTFAHSKDASPYLEGGLGIQKSLLVAITTYKVRMTHVTVMSFTFTLLHRPSGEHDKLATTAFFLPDDVPEMLHITPHPNQLPDPSQTYRKRKTKTHLVNQMSSM